MLGELYFTQVGQDVLAMRSWGHGDPRFVCVHGGLANSVWWTWMVPRLDGRVVALDLPGMGLSSHQDHYALDDFAAKIASCIGDKPVVLIGHSMGALMCYYVALKYPDKVESVCLLDPVLLSWFEDIPLIKARSLKVRKMATMDEVYARYRFIPSQPHPASDIMRILADHAVRRVDGSYQWLFHHDLGLRTASFDHQLVHVGINKPLLLVSAMQSPFYDKELVERFKGLNPNVRCVDVDAYHALLVDHPVEVSSAVKHFVASYSAD